MMSCRLMTVSFLILNFFSSRHQAAILKSSSMLPISYDQKQTGDYNVRLHLKDFQIIAILGEDVLGSLNDDYEEIDYHIPDEYLDVPLPVTENSTSTSISTTSSSSSTLEITKTSITSTALPPRRTVVSKVTTRKQELDSKVTPTPTTVKTPSPVTSTKKIEDVTINLIEDVFEENKNSTNNEIYKKVVANSDSSSVDKIPVVIMQENVKKDLSNTAKKILSASVTIVPSNGESGSKNYRQQVVLGEILQYKKCPQGYLRDKAGHCRIIRRPQIPFDISRLTSNLGSRFKHPTVSEKYIN